MNTVVETLVKAGILVSIGFDKDSNSMYYDLNSGAKSYIHLYPQPNGHPDVVRMRYGEEYEVDCMSDFIWIFQKALRGNDYANDAWWEYIKQLKEKI